MLLLNSYSVTSQLQQANYQWPRFEIVITWNGEMWIPTREILQTSTPQLIASNTWSSRSNRFVKIYLLMYLRHIPFNFEKKKHQKIYFFFVKKKKNTIKPPEYIHFTVFLHSKSLNNICHIYKFITIRFLGFLIIKILFIYSTYNHLSKHGISKAFSPTSIGFTVCNRQLGLQT